MLTDEQLEDLLRFEFRAGAEPDTSRLIDAVTREVVRYPLHGGIPRRTAALREEAAASVGARHWTFAHRWRLALPAGVVATASVLAGLGVFSSGPAALSIETVAYRTTSAVTTAASAEIAYAQTVVTNPSGAVAGNYDWWSQGGSGRVEQLNTDGSPVTDTSWSDANGTLSGREVDYATQSWHATNGEGFGQYPLGDLSDELALGHVIENQLSNGRSENVQSTTLNGESVLEISGTVEIYHASVTKTGAGGNTGTSGSSGTAGDSGTASTQNSSAANNSGTSGNTGTGAASTSAPNAGSSIAAAAARAVASGAVTLTGTTTNWTVWVDPTSYLPVQMVETAADGATATSSIEWLAPTSTNLGQLVSPIPSGFAEVGAPAGQVSPTGNSGS